MDTYTKLLYMYQKVALHRTIQPDSTSIGTSNVTNSER